MKNRFLFFFYLTDRMTDRLKALKAIDINLKKKKKKKKKRKERKKERKRNTCPKVTFYNPK